MVGGTAAAGAVLGPRAAAFGIEPLEGALRQRLQVAPPMRQRQGLDEEVQAWRAYHAALAGGDDDVKTSRARPIQRPALIDA